MAFDPKRGRIDDLERDLYSRDAESITPQSRSEQNPPSTEEKHILYGWKKDEKLETDLDSESVQMKKTDKKSGLVMKVFMASVLFFLVAAGIAAYVILGGFNVISTENVDISIQGLSAVDAGQEVSLDIIIKNYNNATLNSGTLYVNYPEGTRAPQDLTKELTRDQIDLGVVPAGGSVTKNVKAVFFGEKDSIKNIKITLNYKAQGSNANFSKEKVYDVLIKSSPVIMTVDVPQEVNSGQEITLTVEVASNSNTSVRNLLVRAEYPFGFTFKGASPSATFDNNVWRIGDFNPNDKQKITITGRMDGQNDEERTFRFMVGTPSSADEKKIGINYIVDQESLAIRKSFVDLTLRLNSRADNVVVSAGDSIQGTLSWKNNLPVAINDAKVAVKISGTGFDRRQVGQTLGGFFNSVDNTIVWDKNSLPSLRNIDPGSSGSVGFTIGTLPSTPQLLSQGRNLSVNIDATVEGNRVQGDVPQKVNAGITGQAKIGTNIVASGKTLHSTGAFRNTGPIPPKAESETTYTLVFSLANSFNDVADATVKTTLPPYVRWLGNFSPNGESISYDSSSRTVTWRVSDLRAGVGYGNPVKQVSFQVSFVPSLSQVNTVPNLTGPVTLTGTDRFTGSAINITNNALSTNLDSEPGSRASDGKVIQ